MGVCAYNTYAMKDKETEVKKFSQVYRRGCDGRIWTIYIDSIYDLF